MQNDYTDNLSIHALKIMQDEWKQVAITKSFIRPLALAEYKLLNCIIAVREHK